MLEICWNSTIKTLHERQWRRFGVFPVIFKQVSNIVFKILNTVDFEEVIAGQDWIFVFPKILETSE